MLASLFLWFDSLEQTRITKDSLDECLTLHSSSVFTFLLFFLQCTKAFTRHTRKIGLCNSVYPDWCSRFWFHHLHISLPVTVYNYWFNHLVASSVRFSCSGTGKLSVYRYSWCSRYAVVAKAIVFTSYWYIFFTTRKELNHWKCCWCMAWE